MSTLLSRAKLLLDRRTAGAAMVIVPLAAAASAQASSIFIGGDTSMTVSTSGGAFGHANTTVINAGQTAQLTGDTVTNFTDPASNLDTTHAITSNDGVNTDGGITTADVRFHWSGTFDPGNPVTPADFLLIEPTVNPILDPNDGAGTITWTLAVNVSSSSSGTLVDYLSDTQTDNSLGPVATPFTDSGVPATWSATLDLQWAIPTRTDHFGNVFALFPEDQLDLQPSIDLTVISAGPSGAVPAPLPQSVWMGIPLLVAVMGAGRLRTRKKMVVSR